MNIGRMYHRITIQKPINETGRRGTPSQYQTLATVWANVKALPVKQTTATNQMINVGDYEIKIWSRTDIDETCKIVYGTNTYNIVSIVESDPIKKEQTILAKRIKV